MPYGVNHKLSVASSNIKYVDLHPTEPWLLVGFNSDWRGNVNIYNLESGEAVHTHSLRPVECVKFIAHKNWYGVGSGSGWLHIVNCSTHKEVVVLQAHSRHLPVSCLAVHPIAPILLSGGWDNTIKAWDWDNQWRNIQTYHNTAWIMSLAFNPKDPSTFASACDDGTIKMWSIGSSTPIFIIDTHDGSPSCIDFYPGNNKPYLVTASNNRTVQVWDYQTRGCVKTMEGHTDKVKFAVFHPNLPIIISGSLDGTIKIWNSETYEIENTLTYEFGEVSSIALRGDTNQVAVGFKQGVLTLELTPSLSPPSTTPSQSDAVHQHEVDLYQHCIMLSVVLITTKATKKLISELKDDKAQDMVDFLSEMVGDKNTLSQRDRKYALYLLSKLAKSAQVFPQSLELEGVQCILTDPVAAGGYGFIYKGEHEGNTICIKAVRIDSQGVNKKKMRAHAGELTIWAHLFHPNILPFLGIYPSNEQVSRICIVSPWMNNGDLLEYLTKFPDVSRKPLVHDIVSGLQYLHDLDIIHADLKAKNVLVSETGRAMLADFGISRLSITLTTIFTNAGTGTAYWMAPELLVDDEPPSCQSDVWAFACTCYEIITGTMPFSEYIRPPLLIGGFMRGKIVPSKPTPGIGWDEDVWSVAEQCWKSDPESRPKAHDLLEMINGFNFTDDRPSDSESQTRRNDVKVNYDQILSILNEVRQSAAAI